MLFKEIGWGEIISIQFKLPIFYFLFFISYSFPFFSFSVEAAYLEISIDLFEFRMIYFNAFVLVSVNAFLERGPKFRILILLHDIVMILLILPSQECIKREPTKVNSSRKEGHTHLQLG